MHLKILSAKWRPFCPGEDELTREYPANIVDHFEHYLISRNVFEICDAIMESFLVLCLLMAWHSQMLAHLRGYNSEQIRRTVDIKMTS